MPTMNRFKQLLTETDTFAITCEHVPGLVSGGKKIDDILKFAERGVATGLVHAISLTDNPSGAPAIEPDILARELESLGMPAIVHVTTKDLNRGMMESRLRALDRMGVRNLLVMSGDFPTTGQAGLSMPVFDIDPVHTLTMVTLMNRGLRIADQTRALEETPSADFFHGAVFSPFKGTEPETMTQLAKMQLKARAGAQYFVTQFGFDAGKLRPVPAYLAERGITVPVLGSVFILRKGAASAMHRGGVPGSLVTDELLETITREAEAPDKGKAGSLERAAKQIAVLKGLGFRGAHIEAMVMTPDMIETVLGRAEEFSKNWEACAEELSWSPKGSFTLGAPSKKPDCSLMRKRRREGWLNWRLMRMLHTLMFVKTGARGGAMRAFCRTLDRWKFIGGVSHFCEKYLKALLFDCRDCGDCALPEMQYLCPQSQCPKQQRNGPCGGSRLDTCEVYPDRPCIWVKIYTRSKASGELEELRTRAIGPRDWRLRDTSAWVNFHLNRDHTGYDFTTLFEAPRAGNCARFESRVASRGS